MEQLYRDMCLPCRSSPHILTRNVMLSVLHSLMIIYYAPFVINESKHHINIYIVEISIASR